MTKDDEKGKLDVVEHGRGFAIAYMFEDFGRGLTLGESGDVMDENMAEPDEREEWEHWIAIDVIRKLAHGHDARGYFWESVSAAKKALAAVKTRHKLGREMPDWAKKATEAGWKPPKGWKP